MEVKIDILDKEAEERSKELENLTKNIDVKNKNDVQNKELKCRYFNQGYCRNQSWCTFSHPENICETFLLEGNCVVPYCPSRHPRICKYWSRGHCYRGEQCAFSHRQLVNKPKDIIDVDVQTCENCEETGSLMYFCEFCRKDFYLKCTKEEAHEKDYAKKQKYYRLYTDPQCQNK